MTSSQYDDPFPEEYVAPPSLEFFGNMLSFRDERSILNLIEAKTSAEDNGRQTQVDYVQGLVGIAVCFVSFWVLWLIILAVLNCAGERVGCASGRPFRSSQLFLREDKKPKTREGRLDYSSWRRDNQRILASGGRTASQPRIDYLDGLWRYETSGSIGDQHEQQGEDEFEDEIFSTLSGASTKSSWTHRMRSACCSDSREQVERRKRRTRVAYCVAFLVVELTGILLFVYLCYPMVGISTNAWSLIEEGRDVRSQVDQSLNEIRAAVEIVDGLIKKTPRDPLLICPRDTEMDAASLMIGNDFQTVLGLLASDYPDVLKTAQADLDAASSITDTLDHVLSKSTAILEESESRLWILPFIVLSSMIVNWIFGMVFAMTAFATPRNEDQKEEKPRWKYKTAFLLNRILLPVAILLATLAFFLSTALLVSGAMASDSCIAGEDQSPDAMIEAIISQQQFAHNLDDFTARTLKAYTVEACLGEDPVEDVTALEGLLEDATGLMHRWIQQTHESDNLPLLEEACGEGNLIPIFFQSVFLLHDQLWNIQEALGEVREALSCRTIHFLYIDTIHDLACSQTASAVAAGAILMMIHAISSLVLVTLQAAWR